MPDRRFDPLDELRPLLPIPEAWRRLGLPGEPGPRCRSPFREDRHPSFTIFGNDLWWKDQSTGDSVIFTCAKNNNGEEGPSTAWHRKNGLFVPCQDFDWEEWENGEAVTRRSSVELEDLAEVFQKGNRTLSRPEAVKILEQRYDIKRSYAYQLLRCDGRFAGHLTEAAGFLMFKP